MEEHFLFGRAQRPRRLKWSPVPGSISGSEHETVLGNQARPTSLIMRRLDIKVFPEAQRVISVPPPLLQISSLVTLQLMTQVSHDDQLDAPKYKCAVSMDFICAISRCEIHFSTPSTCFCFLHFA